jgi:hypothetical protein
LPFYDLKTPIDRVLEIYENKKFIHALVTDDKNYEIL